MNEENTQVQDQTPSEQAQTPLQPEPETKDRTAEQFDKLTKSNQELKAERDAALEENKQYASVIEGLLPNPQAPQVPFQQYQQPINQAPSARTYQNLSQQQVQSTFDSMVDENGYLDGVKLKQTLEAMDQRAKQAEQRAEKVEKRLQERDQNEAENRKKTLTQQLHEKFPQLNPENSDQFNPDFWEAVRNEMLGQLVHNGQEDPLKAANKWFTRFYQEGGEDMSKKQQAQKAEDQKRQINATRPRSTSNLGYYAQEEEGALLQQVRQGRKGSVAELLRRRGQ